MQILLLPSLPHTNGLLRDTTTFTLDWVSFLKELQLLGPSLTLLVLDFYICFVT